MITIEHSSVLNFMDALNGGKGELDAWLECNNGQEVREHIRAALCEVDAWLECNNEQEVRAYIRAALGEVDAEPVAWMYDIASYLEGDARGRGWVPTISRFKPAQHWMLRHVFPLYAAQPANPVAWDHDDFDICIKQRAKPTHPQEGWRPLYTEQAAPAAVPRKREIPPPPVDALEVVYTEGWNAACDAFFNGLPPQEPLIITVTQPAPAALPQLMCKKCGADRAKETCRNRFVGCPMTGVAMTTPGTGGAA